MYSFLATLFRTHTYDTFSKNKKWSVSTVTFHGKPERSIDLVRTVKDWGFKCLLYHEEEEVIILRKKAFILKDLIRPNFNYTSQLVTSNKVKIADSPALFTNSECWIWFFTCCHFCFKKQWFCFFIYCHYFTKQIIFFPCVVNIHFIRKEYVLSNCHCSLNKQRRHRQCSY